jgi:hypothetical protein
MTAGGWLFMGAGWLLILGLFAYSMYRVLTEKDEPEA